MESVDPNNQFICMALLHEEDNYSYQDKKVNKMQRAQNVKRYISLVIL